MKKLLFVDIHGTLLYYPRGVKERSDTQPIFPELPAFFKELSKRKEEGFKIIALTNSKVSNHQIAIELELAGFDHTIFSAIYSCPKPPHDGERKLWADFFRLSKIDPLIFAQQHSNVPLQAITKATKILEIAQSEGVSKRNLLLVGDTPSTDLLAARLIGIQHAWANPRKKLNYLQPGYREHPAFKEPKITPKGGQKRHNWINQKAVKRFLRP